MLVLPIQHWMPFDTQCQIFYDNVMSAPVADKPASLRERKRDALSAKLQEVAYALFVEHGFDDVTVADIAEGALVSRRTFFRLFPTKEAVAFPREHTRALLFQQALASRAHLPPFRRVREACLDVADDFARHRDQERAQRRLIQQSQVLAARERAIFDGWNALIVDALLTGVDAKPLRLNAQARTDIAMYGAALTAALRVTLSTWAEQTGGRRLRVRGEHAFALMARAMPQSLRILEDTNNVVDDDIH